MDVHRLELLRELSDRGSITAVAEATNRTVSAVSQQLKVLEREAGVPLTEKSGRGLVLTGAGRMLAQTARDVAVALERADAVWEDFKQQPRGEVSITMFRSGAQMLLIPLLDQVALMPGVTLRASDQDPLLPDFGDLVTDFDIVVADSPGTLPTWGERGLAVVKLFDEPLDVALPEGHRLAAKASLSPRDVVDETWVGVPVDSAFDRILQQVEVVTGRPARVSQRFIDNGIVESLVAAGQGLAILPRFTTQDHENGLITRPLTGIRSSRQVSALLRPDVAERPSVRLVVEALRMLGREITSQHAA